MRAMQMHTSLSRHLMKRPCMHTPCSPCSLPTAVLLRACMHLIGDVRAACSLPTTIPPSPTSSHPVTPTPPASPPWTRILSHISPRPLGSRGIAHALMWRSRRQRQRQRLADRADLATALHRPPRWVQASAAELRRGSISISADLNLGGSRAGLLTGFSAEA